MSFACRHCLVALRPVTSPPRSFTVFPDDSIYRAQLRMHKAFRLASIAPKLIVPTSWLLSFSISGGGATAPCYSAVKKKASWNFIHSIHSYFVETPENFPKLSSQRIGLDTAFIIGLPECRTSTTTIPAQCSLPDLNHDHPRPVFPAGPQPGVSTPSVPCRTSCRKIKCQIECQKICQVECQKICQKICQIDVPEDIPEDMPDRMPDRMPEDMSEYMPEDMPDRMPDRMP